MQTSTFTGKEYLALDIAGLYGLDKKTWSERLAWFKENEPKLESLADKADSPACYIAAVNAWRDVQAGKAIGYPINLDATASGCQILALLTGDKKAATRVNLVNTGNREDLYTYIYNKMKELAPSISDSLTRDQVKRSIMTSLYGSEAKPKEVFGEDNFLLFEHVMNQELPAVWKLNKFLLNNWNPKKTVYSWIMPDNFHVDCKVEKTLTFEAKVLNQDIQFNKKVEQSSDKGRFLSANLAHSVDGLINREITMRCNFSEDFKNHLKKLLNLNVNLAENEEKYYKQPKGNFVKFTALWERFKKSGFMSVRLLQYVTEDTLLYVGKEGRNQIRELIDSLPEHTFEVFSIHDCYRVLPNYGNDLRQQYRYVCKQIADSNMLSDILSSMFDTELDIQKLDNSLGEEVMKSEYAVC